MPKIVCIPDPADNIGLCRMKVRIPQRGVTVAKLADVLKTIDKGLNPGIREDFDFHLTDGECDFWFVINPQAPTEVRRKIQFLVMIVREFGLEPIIEGSVTTGCRHCNKHTC